MKKLMKLSTPDKNLIKPKEEALYEKNLKRFWVGKSQKLGF